MTATVEQPGPLATVGQELIRVRGARVHNLRNLDVDLPRDRLVVITGPSGSGKSSLAFDTLFAEGQRQYLETLSVYTRQFLHQLERPDVDAVEGLPPTVCIDQRPGNQNPRSTVATVTEVYDYLRLLMARLGAASCYQCGAAICQQTPEQIQLRLTRLPAGTKTILLAPMVRGRKGEHKEVFVQIRKAGFLRARVDGEIYDLDHVPELAAKRTHHIDAVVDRLIIRPGLESRVGDSVRLAVKFGGGLVVACYHVPAGANGEADDDRANRDSPPHVTAEPQVTTAGGEIRKRDGHGQHRDDNAGHGGATNGWRDELFSTHYACPNCEISYEELEPRTFSFNSPYGACPVCEGLGSREEFDPDLILPNPNAALADGAVAPWKGIKAAPVTKLLDEVSAFLVAQKSDPLRPLAELSPPVLDKLLRGDGKKFPGLILLLEKEYATATDAARREQLETFRGPVRCTACAGSRLRPESTSVRFRERAIHEITRLSVGEAHQFFRSQQFNADEEPIGQPIVREVCKRLAFLEKVGVDYLTLDRPADTLSGGELQRVRLATSIGSGLVGVCYVLDEPSIGLHQRDNQRLIDALRDLQQLGNTVLVVEHDEAMMRQADWLIDVGPGAGVGGGCIIAQGTPDEVSRDPQSITGQYLSGRLRIAVPAQRRRVAKTRSLVLEGVTTNNLKDISVQFPLGVFTCVTGVSGSGKSSLVNETLVPALVRRLGGVAAKPGPCTSLRGASQIDKVIPIDQSPLGRTPRSNPATFTGVFDEVRKAFASTREAKQRGFRHSRFSFNAKGGRCEECQGQGLKRIEMKFMPDLFVPCNECGGARFNRATLQVRYRGQSIADVLEQSVDDATVFFENFPAIVRSLQSLRDVGLGYLRLGQPSNTLSGGEGQRIKLATELARADTGNTLYVLDEPTTGLHFDDIRRLLDVLGRLVDKGNTVIVIEHNLDIVKCADWLIDLGPEGGAAGGHLLATGTPEEIAALPENSTGQFLRPLLPASGL